MGLDLNMRSLKIMIILGLALSSNTALALDNEFSFGIATGTDSGLTIKYWTSDTHALDFFAEWDTSSSKYIFQADYLTHDFKIFDVETGSLPFYYGVGARVESKKGSSTKTGLRIPLGISYLMETAPIDFFGEFGPRIDLTPETDFELDIMLGIRYRIMP